MRSEMRDEFHPGTNFRIDPRSTTPAKQRGRSGLLSAQGNTSAEVALARLYLIGGGVPKSCDQARFYCKPLRGRENGELWTKLSQIDIRAPLTFV